MGQLATWRHSPDEVVDFLVSEALLHNINEHEKKQEENAEEKQKQTDFLKFKDKG